MHDLKCKWQQQLDSERNWIYIYIIEITTGETYIKKTSTVFFGFLENNIVGNVRRFTNFQLFTIKSNYKDYDILCSINASIWQWNNLQSEFVSKY